MSLSLNVLVVSVPIPKGLDPIPAGCVPTSVPVVQNFFNTIYKSSASIFLQQKNVHLTFVFYITSDSASSQHLYSTVEGHSSCRNSSASTEAPDSCERLSSVSSVCASCFFVSMSLNALKLVKYKFYTVVLLQQVYPFPWNYREFGPHPHSVTVKYVSVTAE